jgi:hypothetical protein
LLLELVRLRHPSLRVLKTSIRDENKKGTDWEWWIGATGKGWLRFATQAKRVNVTTGRYDQLGFKVGTRRQRDILKRYADANKAIPLYVLYNYFAGANASHWHCTQPIEVSQLGCSIAPLSVVDQALSTRGGRTFDYIHNSQLVLPWRCLISCKHFTGSVFSSGFVPGSAEVDKLQGYFGVRPHIYDVLPGVLQNAGPFSLSDSIQTMHLECTFLTESEHYNAECGLFPRQIVIVEV